MYALVALGYTMVYGILQLINFAHGEVLMIGAMVALTTVTMLAKAWPGIPGPVLLVIGVLVAVPVCATISVIIERIAYRPLRNAPKLAPLVSAIGVSFILLNIGL